MSDSEEENIPTIAEDVVVTKYKMAAEIANNVLKELIGKCEAGVKIVDLCDYGDRRIEEECGKVYKKEKEMKKGIAFPTCVNVNNIISYFSPLYSEAEDLTLKAKDVVNIHLGVHLNGLPVVVGHTVIVGPIKKEDVESKIVNALAATQTLTDVVIRMLKPGTENFKITEMAQKVCDDYKVKLIEGIRCHNMGKNMYNGEKAIVWNPSEDQRKAVEKCEIAQYDVWNINLLVSTGEGKPKESSHRTTVYKKNDIIYQLKMKASRQLFSEIATKYENFPFTMRSMQDEKKARMGIVECVKHDLLDALHVYQEKDNEFVVQSQFTVLIMPNGPLRISNGPSQTMLDVIRGGNAEGLQLLSSEYKVENVEVKAILLTAIKTNRKKKKGGAAANKTDQAMGDQNATAGEGMASSSA